MALYLWEQARQPQEYNTMTADTSGAPVWVHASADGLVVRNALPSEAEILESSFTRGSHWVRRGADGRIEHVPALKQLPDPITDEELHPFWEGVPRDGGGQLELFNLTDQIEVMHFRSSSIIIRSLCGHYYTRERYSDHASQLESYGFECFRSRRGPNGRFTELWYLPGLWSAQGKLKEVLEPHEREDKLGVQLEVALDFLRNRISFGALDVTVQRLGMMPDD